MNGTGSGGRKAYSELAGKLRMGARHEGGKLLMASLYVMHLLGRAAERTHDAVDAIAGIAKNPPHAPLMQPLE